MEWTRGRAARTELSVALAGAAIVAVVLALWLLPPWLVDQAGPELESAELTRAVTEERRNVLAGLVAIGAAVTLWYTHQRQELDRDANRTDRYTKAVEQLGDDTKPSVQLGGVYALERVANDSRRDRGVSIEVLSAFVRQQSKRRAVDVDAATTATGGDSQVPTGDPAGGAYQTSEPVLAAFYVLSRRPRGDRPYPAYPGLNLEGAYVSRAFALRANLAGANLTHANLTFAILAGADLFSADLADAILAGADLFSADLTGANLTRANLTRANLAFADLTGADLTGADLTGADLTGANLTGANLIGADLTGVRHSDNTTWPEAWPQPPLA